MRDLWISISYGRIVQETLEVEDQFEAFHGD
jgi:hypothetical protein